VMSGDETGITESTRNFKGRMGVEQRPALHGLTATVPPSGGGGGAVSTHTASSLLM